MGPIDERRIAEMRQRISAASPGPWVISRDESGQTTINTGRADRRKLYIKRDSEPAGKDDIAFVAQSRAALPRLLDALVARQVDALKTHELDEIEKVVVRASPGPWTAFFEGAQPIGGCSMIWVSDEADGRDMYVWLEDEIAPDPDIEFIAAAREDIPDLLSEIRYGRRKREGT